MIHRITKFWTILLISYNTQNPNVIGQDTKVDFDLK